MTREELDDKERSLLKPVCEAIGYGRVMQLAEQMWSEKSAADGHPGSEHTTGPCAASMVLCECREREPDEDYKSCDWCGGAGRVTKHVREVQRSGTRT